MEHEDRVQEPERKTPDVVVAYLERVQARMLDIPGIAMAVGVVGVFSIVGGIVLCVQSWPGDPGSGYTWRADAYTPAYTWLFYGLISGVLFFAGAAALTYLHATREYAKAICHKLLGASEKRQQRDREYDPEDDPDFDEWKRKMKTPLRKI